MDEHAASKSDINSRLNRSLDSGLNGDEGDGDSRFSENKINGKCFWNTLLSLELNFSSSTCPIVIICITTITFEINPFRSHYF